MASPGPKNLITDVLGVRVGNATDERVGTGVTVLRFSESFVTAADVRGGGPGSREIDVLSSENLVGRADAIVFAGGSVFGLGAADGVANTLSVQGTGLRLGEKGPAIPIVPAAVLHDLTNPGDKEWGDTPPYHELGKKALANAGETFEIGAVGAGRGARAGLRPGGLGSTSLILDDGIAIGALVAANPAGSVYGADGKRFYAGAFEIGEEFGGRGPADDRGAPGPFPEHSRLKSVTAPGTNTTLAAIVINADLTNVEARRIAIMAHDGFARAIRPVHTPFDGDIIFVTGTGEKPLTEGLRPFQVAAIGSAAADCVARAVARAVFTTEAGPEI